MADYIYLLQNRLTPAQRQALEAVRDAARAHGMTVFLVGGAVRDLSSGTPVRDLDFAVQGETAALVSDLRTSGAVLAGENPVLLSSYLIFQGGVRAEVGPTLTVTYPKPGQPETQPAAILDDLRRRDFTANAMAISLNEGSYGLLLDPLNGIADMENRELRLVSNYGFIEQPGLLLRAARLSERLGWTLEERTQGRYATAKEENYISALPASERGYELEEIFHEEDPLSALAHLHDEGWGELLFPAWTDSKADRDGLDRVRDLMGQMEQMGIHTDPSPAFFPLLTAKLAPKDVAELKASFARPGFVEQIDQLETRSKDLAAQMTSKSAAAASDTWKLLFSAEPVVVLWLAFSSRSSAVQAKFRSFLNEWPQMRQRIPYALMQEMRITPDLPGYEALLDDLFFALIDGKLATGEATRAFLEPFSPPAPAPLTSPRRRPAKAARSRSRKAAEPVVAAAEPGEENGDPEETSAATAVAKPAAETPAPKTAAAGKSAPVKTTVGVPMAAKKSVSGSRQEIAASKVDAAKPALKKAIASAAVPAKSAAKAVAPAKTAAPPTTKVAGKTTGKPAKSAQTKTVAGKSSPGSAKSPAKTAPVKVAAAKGKPVAKKIAAKAVAKAPVKGVVKGSAAAKRQTSGRSTPVPVKLASAPKKAAKTATKGRSGR